MRYLPTLEWRAGFAVALVCLIVGVSQPVSTVSRSAEDVGTTAAADADPCPSSPCTLSTPGTYTFTVPASVTSVSVQVWGGGGGAGGGCTNLGGVASIGGAGGGGGGYAAGSVTVVAGQTSTVTVGSAGRGGSSTTAGGASLFGSVMTANGGGRGGGGSQNCPNSGPGGTGGTAVGGTTNVSGSNGTAGSANGAGGNGGAAGGPGGGAGGTGGAAPNGDGGSGSVPGGAGGGDGGNGTQGSSANGRVVITWQPLTISPSVLPTLRVGTPFTVTFSATGGTGALTFNTVSGNEIPGITFNGGTATMSGTPTTAGPYFRGVKVTDSAGNTSSTTYIGVVLGANATQLTILPATLPPMTVGAPFTVTLTVSGGTGTGLSFNTNGGTSIPGIFLNGTTGVLNGTPTTAGPYSRGFVVTDSAGNSGAITYSGTINNPGTAPPFGQVDTPAQSATGVQGAIGVTGWALDDTGIASLKIYRNCLSFENQASCQTLLGNKVVFVGDAAFLAGARTDVEAAFPTMPQANRAGWGYLLLTSMLPHVTGSLAYGGQGALTLYAYATDLEGNATLLGRSQTDHTATSITMANDSIAKPFGAIDTPTQGETVSGTYANFGWALTPDSNTTADATDILILTNGSTMNVIIDGAAVGKVAYNQCRGNVGNPVPSTSFCNDDVASIFGNATPQATLTTRTANATKYRNLDAGRAAIGAFSINTTTLSNGLHTIVWGVTDSGGRPEGIGSRFFTVQNSGAVAADASADAPAMSRGSAATLQMMGVAREGIWARTGFDLQAPFTVVYPTAGVRTLQIDDLGRAELWLGPVDSGALVANGTLRDLPPGSRLDTATGQFTWAPGPGYLGTYHLEFLRGPERIRVDVTIRPPS